jgi:hypothetical protein
VIEAADRLAIGSIELILPVMVEKPAPKSDETYSDEEAAKRTDATIRAMIGMKPSPRETKRPSKPASRVKRPLC